MKNEAPEPYLEACQMSMMERLCENTTAKSFIINVWYGYKYTPLYSKFSDKEKQLFWNLKFHAVLSTIFSQLTLTLNYYNAIVSSWRNVISPVPESKTHPYPAMTQHIRERSRNSPHPKVSNGGGALASPPPMLKYKTVVYFPFLHQWCSIVSERFSSKNYITQGPVHRIKFDCILQSCVLA